MSNDRRRSTLTALPSEVAAAAVVFDNGEIAWPGDSARSAINALAASGQVILGLDAQTYYPDGGHAEVAVSDWRERSGESRTEQVERARTEALAALPLALQLGTHVLITW